MMKGLGKSMVGTQIKAISKKAMLKNCWKPAEPMTGEKGGSIAPPFKAIPIIFEIIEGAYPSLPVKSVVHLAMIIQSM